MSIAAKITKFVMRLINVQGIISRSSNSDLHERSIPQPVKEVERQHSLERVEVGKCHAYWLSKEKKAAGTLVYLHGGAFVVGPIKSQWKYISEMALKSGQAAVVVNYRQLPDHPYPDGLNDVVDVLHYLLDEEKLLHWSLVGDSAGGNLALAASYKLREQGRPLPNKVILMSPFLDASMSNPDISEIEKRDPLLSKSLRFGKEDYAPESEWTSPFVSPIYGDLRGLPPTLLQVGTDEIMLADSQKLKEKALKAGVDLRLTEYEGMFHIFPMFPFLPEAKEARREQLEFLKS